MINILAKRHNLVPVVYLRTQAHRATILIVWLSNAEDSQSG